MGFWVRGELGLKGIRFLVLQFANLAVAPPCNSALLLLFGRRRWRGRCDDGWQEAHKEDDQEEAHSSTGASASSASCGASRGGSRGASGGAFVASSSPVDAACNHVFAHPLVLDGCGAGHDGVCGANDHCDAGDIRVCIRSTSDDRFWKHGVHHRRNHVVRNTSLCNHGLHHWYDSGRTCLIGRAETEEVAERKGLRNEIG